jgi:nucleotide-binding universal stress UspA family protein
MTGAAKPKGGKGVETGWSAVVQERPDRREQKAGKRCIEKRGSILFYERKGVQVMYPKVLVPLDGSELAECALPEVIKLGRGGVVGEVILLRVISTEAMHIPKAYEMSIDYSALRNADRDESRRYLEGIQSRLQAEGIRVSAELLEGRSEEKIIDYARDRSVDLIVIATHGYTGVKRLMFGSVALQVLHDANVPVLLIRVHPGKAKV